MEMARKISLSNSGRLSIYWRDLGCPLAFLRYTTLLFGIVTLALIIPEVGVGEKLVDCLFVLYMIVVCFNILSIVGMIIRTNSRDQISTFYRVPVPVDLLSGILLGFGAAWIGWKISYSQHMTLVRYSVCGFLALGSCTVHAGVAVALNKDWPGLYRSVCGSSKGTTPRMRAAAAASALRKTTTRRHGESSTRVTQCRPSEISTATL